MMQFKRLGGHKREAAAWRLRIATTRHGRLMQQGRAMVTWRARLRDLRLLRQPASWVEYRQDHG
ncbi:hypothetical protein [Nocardia beijingensis]